ncbi:hypothetical protein DevBK_07305 [Devosia sp. BK]|uniref:hypothetical protein n=1 Tax=Devosia sp. BK TaxID=2871706 RepID=UPI00293AD598|nr:hypothetical protein [Devosia sp. BK]MDV3251130.1 hypothetical protein [Devosia sp. BK]
MREAAVTKTHPQEALFRGFALALLSGTDMSNADDELLWPSTSIHRSRELISAVEAFAEWSDTSAARTAILPAKLKQAPSDQLNVTDMLIWARMRNVSMLRHIKAPNIVRRTNIIDFGPDTRGHGSEPVKFFPPDHVERLLWEGHVRPGMEHEPNPFLRFNVRDQMIALLDAWGGLRRSDGLHLWVNDVVEEPKKPGHALVVLNHPSEAKVEWFDPIARRTVKLTRAEVLRRQYDLLPRNQVTRGRYHVGWKNLELNREHQAFVYWLEQSAGDLFWVLYLGYLRHVRAPIMQRRKALGGYDHPFLFVSLGGSNTDGGMIGDPLSSQAYTDSHERAVLRLGLEHSKEAGTSTHGLRHLYGQTLANLGVSAAIIKKGMHHRHLLSQVPYTVPTADRVNSVLRAAVSGQPLEQQPLGHESALALRDLHQFIVGGTPRV